ncbi:MAG: class I SAM-dependent methyltransferase [Intrasporangium sp.]|uniref:O-methyltransferase n=1 Tax=Intrasporangium sp. TaxID=1925024 RepID=UPI002647A5B1|nr:class I SAM-dependent methyltransferase [Intrasporangium sp.]MDN5798367.1 class I SAM-dependent methyltransferase [Intrasporangium sp.]
MSSQKLAAWAHAEEFIAPSEHVEAARRRADELGVSSIDNGAGATLQVLAAAAGARAVMEVGTGTGVSGLWLLGGMAPDGILTTIDMEPEHQRAARATFAAAGVAHQRTRVITGRAAEVLPRMTDGAYDMLVVDADRSDYPSYVEQATRLLRAGGTLVMSWSDRESDPAARDPETTTLREVARLVRDQDHFTAALLPVSSGLVVAVKR